MHVLARYFDLRRSLGSAIGWLVFALSIGLALLASLAVGDIVRANLLDERVQQLDRMADRVAAEVNFNLAIRLQSVRALAAMMATELQEDSSEEFRQTLQGLRQTYPEFEWVGVANPQGHVLAATDDLMEGASVVDRPWFVQGLAAASVRIAQQLPRAVHARPTQTGTQSVGPLVELDAPIVGANGQVVGVIGAYLRRDWLRSLAVTLAHELEESPGTESLVLDQHGTVLMGLASREGKRWQTTGESTAVTASILAAAAPRNSKYRLTGFKRPSNGTRYLVALAQPEDAGLLQGFGWHVVVLQPLQDVSRRARVLQGQLAAALLVLGSLAAVIGALLARRVTRDLEAIARSADAVRSGATQEITVPPGRNEVARLGRALSGLLKSLQRERNALQTLNVELDQRVDARTREIKRLAEQARYAAVTRERLKIARDLHDTLAHSMMAMLTEIRILKRISTTNPGALGEELKRAEDAAHQGLKEARDAITQMRFNPVRDAGIAAAIGDFVKQFVERTGIPVDYTSDAAAAAFADERAETLFRIAEEAMRNIERHAGATHATISLRECHDGHGLTLTISDNGVGFNADAPHPMHYGVAGLREHAHLIGADLTIVSAANQGTAISVVLELDS